MQDLILEHSAFTAILTLTNAGMDGMTDVSVMLRFFDASLADITNSGTPQFPAEDAVRAEIQEGGNRV